MNNHSLEPSRLFLHDCILYLQTYLTYKMNAYFTHNSLALQIIASSSMYTRSLFMESCAEVHDLHCPEIGISLGGAIRHLLCQLHSLLHWLRSCVSYQPVWFP